MRLVHYKVRRVVGPSSTHGTPEVYTEHNLMIDDDYPCSRAEAITSLIKFKIRAELGNPSFISDSDIIICDIIPLT